MVFFQVELLNKNISSSFQSVWISLICEQLRDKALLYKLCWLRVQVTLNPDELDMDTVAMQAKYDQTMKQQQANDPKEDFSDMVAEHSAKAAKVGHFLVQIV